MNPRAWPVALLIAGLGGCLGGCAVGPDVTAPQPAMPQAYAAAAAAAPAPRSGPAGAPTPIDPGLWWQAFGDATLDQLVQQALRENPGLDGALASLQAARSVEMALAGTALPRLEAGSGGGRGTGSDLTRGRVASPLQSADHTLPGTTRITQIAGVDALWDFDLFGGIRREIEAARYDAQAAAAARDAVQIALVAEVVRTYVDLRGLQLQIAVLRQNLQAAQSLADLVQARFERGITNELDVTLAQRQLASVRAQLAPLEAQRTAAQYALAALTGRFPQDLRLQLDAPAMIPAFPDRIDPGVPLDLLRRRPDIRAAEWSLAAATARIGVATARLFPQVSLSGGWGVEHQASGYRPTAGASIWSLGYSATLPPLDFGVLDALVDVADLQARAQLDQYKQTVLRAVQDVDTALAGYAAQRERLQALGTAVQASQRAMSLASERYDRGLTDFLNVVDAQRQEYELEGEYAAAQTSFAEQFVAVYRALGGGWEKYTAPEPPRPLPAALALFRRLHPAGPSSPAGPAAAAPATGP